MLLYLPLALAPMLMAELILRVEPDFSPVHKVGSPLRKSLWIFININGLLGSVCFIFSTLGCAHRLCCSKAHGLTRAGSGHFFGEGDLCCCHHQVVNKNSLRKPCTARLTVKVAPLAPVVGAWASTADSLKTPASGQQKDLHISGVVPSTSWTPVLHLISSGRRREACDGFLCDSPTSPRANACPNCSS